MDDMSLQNLRVLADESNWETNQVFTEKGSYFSMIWINDIYDPQDLAEEILKNIEE